MGVDVPPIPDLLREDLAYMLGEAEAARWLYSAVAHARFLFDEWALHPHEVLTGGSQSLCIRCEDEAGREVVLKIPASVDGGASEIAALGVWDGNGAARVLREDRARAVMLMNFLGRVSDTSYTLPDLLDLAGRLHGADPSAYRFAGLEENLARRVAHARERFGDAEYADQRPDLATAETLIDDLVGVGARVLLHGDLQAKNLILHGTELTAVDPLPVLGPGIFDIAFWIAKSPHSGPTMPYVDRVVALCPDLDRGLLLRWAWAIAVVENRPYAQATAAARQQFIDEARDLVS